jgi:hypothetical protein
MAAVAIFLGVAAAPCGWGMSWWVSFAVTVAFLVHEQFFFDECVLGRVEADKQPAALKRFRRRLLVRTSGEKYRWTEAIRRGVRNRVPLWLPSVMIAFVIGVLLHYLVDQAWSADACSLGEAPSPGA